MKRALFGILFSLWASAASATVTCTLPFNLQNGTQADATQVMANYNALVTCLTQAASAGVNNDITALTAITTPITPAQGGTPVYSGGTSTGSANVQVVGSVLPAGFSLTAGKRITFISGFTNTGNTSVNVAGTGPVLILKPSPAGPIALAGGEIVVGNYVEAVYDGTQFEIYNSALPQAYGPSVAAASAATVDLGLVLSHNVAITGTSTITSFGSSATVTYPIYKILFAGALTLTYNASTMLLPGAADIVTVAGDTAEAQYFSGGIWKIINYTRTSGTAVVNPSPMSGAQGLVIANNSGTPNTNIDIVADQAVMLKPAGAVPIYASTVSLTVNTTTTGANGLDTGARASSTWYHLFLISNGATTAGLASLSATAPTLPTGYVYWVRVGAMRTDGSGNFYRIRQQGSHAVYTPVTASNTSGPISMAGGSNAAWTAIATGNYVPPTATQIKGVMSSVSMGNNTTTSVAPNNNYPTAAVGNSGTTPWSITNATGAANGLSANMVFEFNLESTNIYYASNSGGATTILAMGWTDKVNAN